MSIPLKGYVMTIHGDSFFFFWSETRVCPSRRWKNGAATAVLLLTLLAPASSLAQDAPRRHLQAGLGVLPGAGIQIGYVAPRNLYTLETLLYVDTTPQFAGGEGNVQSSAGVGAALRPFGFVRAAGNAQADYDLDVGLRFGPSLFFTTNATRKDKNQQFRLFLEPFIRVSGTGEGSRTYYVEVGTHRPFLRGGILFDL